MYFPEFSESAKVWVYQSDKPFDNDTRIDVNLQLKDFVDRWSAHGKKLKASAEVIGDYHIVLCVEGDVQASGCSIDASVRFLKELSSYLKVNLFNRMLILISGENKDELVHFSELGNRKDAKMYNPVVDNLGDLRKNWVIPVAEFLN